MVGESSILVAKDSVRKVFIERNGSVTSSSKGKTCQEHAIGVADGVGGWGDSGVHAGFYSRELMSHSVDAIQKEPKGSIDPARVLEKAHSITKAMGSSTACIIALTDQGLNAINLGDSGFMVIRDGCTLNGYVLCQEYATGDFAQI
ncbi:probable protein phosphatase 2C 55 [Arachis stenosperma]|uniref:probable protein phosphatase 2C 55 n=1 Tax=Arachis stenosperma TaxID=217475 RepID=UPI0025AD3085|nr:probable protein phosphatase 2C 55 [Arachis stenosperma]